MTVTGFNITAGSDVGLIEVVLYLKKYLFVVDEMKNKNKIYCTCISLISGIGVTV